MKKLVFWIAAAIAALTAFSLTSCTSSNENSGFSFVYNVNVDGDADGNVAVTFPNGSLDLNGDADLAFIYSNDTTNVFVNTQAMTQEQVLASNDANLIAAFESANTWVDETFTVSAAQAGGTYDVQIKGYVKETLTGIIFAIDKRLTNRENAK